MTRYREMTDKQLVEWALAFQIDDHRSIKLIYALAKRLEERSPQTRATVPEKLECVPRPRGQLTLATLSREAKAWLREYRPDRLAVYAKMARVEQVNSGGAADVRRQQAWTNGPLSGMVNQGMSGHAGYVRVTSSTGAHVQCCPSCHRAF